jgi:hypothetical protein
MVEASFSTFLEALVGFEPTYPARSSLSRGLGLATSLQRHPKREKPVAMRLLCVTVTGFLDFMDLILH